MSGTDGADTTGTLVTESDTNYSQLASRVRRPCPWSAPGRRHHAAGYNGGSIAIAPADCDVAGERFLNLTGGSKITTARRGSEPAVALAPGSTNWRVDGVTAGVGHDATRLLVIAL